MENAPAGSQYFKALYTKEKYFLTGLHLDINLWNLFAGNRQNPGRFTMVLSPGVYLQKFSPTVNAMSNNQQFAAKLKNNIDYGFGANLAFRYRASRLIDLQLKANWQYIHNQNFDGIVNTAEHNIGGFKYTWYSWEVSAMVGIIFKLGKKSKKDNLIWSTNRYEHPAPAPAPQQEAAPAPAPAPVPVVEPTPEPVYETVVLPVIPAVHFKRDNAVIDREKYKAELEEILSVLTKYPEVKFRIEGFADKTGTDPINARLSTARAEALKAYLLEKGISESRITEVKGEGVDRLLSGKEAYTVKARRAVAITIEKEIKIKK